MAYTLKGSPELRRRLRAIKTAFKPVARQWADETVALMKPAIPVRTGKTRRSIRRGRATTKSAKVVGSYVTNFIDAGTKAHTIVPKKGKTLRFEVGGRPVFAKKVNHPRVAARPFKKAAASVALQKIDVAGDLVRLWNEAA